MSGAERAGRRTKPDLVIGVHAIPQRAAVPQALLAELGRDDRGEKPPPPARGPARRRTRRRPGSAGGMRVTRTPGVDCFRSRRSLLSCRPSPRFAVASSAMRRSSLTPGAVAGSNRPSFRTTSSGPDDHAGHGGGDHAPARVDPAELLRRRHRDRPAVRLDPRPRGLRRASRPGRSVPASLSRACQGKRPSRAPGSEAHLAARARPSA
jgi:hypothetical protein